VIEPELVPYILMAVAGLGSIVAVYLAIVERDLLKAVIYSAVQSTFYALLFYLLMAPDIVLVYIPVAVGLLPAVLIFVIKKTERYEEEAALSKASNALLITSIVVFTVSAVFALMWLGGLGEMPAEKLRLLAQVFIYTSYNQFHEVVRKLFTAASPETVTAIVWDFRGLDTFFETAVMYLAIVGAIALYRGVALKPRPVTEDSGMSIIAKTVLRITAPAIIAVAASIALHGHLTPGGGFQGGSTAAVAAVMLLFIFSSTALIQLMGYKKAVALRSVGLLGIFLTAVSTLLIGLAVGSPAYIFQNQPKVGSPIGLPASVGSALISGTLWFFNLSEFLAVFAGFSILFALISVPEDEVKEAVLGEEHE